MWAYLPEYALIELPAEVVLDLHVKANFVKDFGFVYEDLIDDCLVRISDLGTLEDDLEDWFDEIAMELDGAGLSNHTAYVYLDSVNNLFQSLRLHMHGLYTPSGRHYYKFCKWFNSSTMVLEKEIYSE